MRNLTHRVARIPDKTTAADLFLVLSDVYNEMQSVMLSTAGLVISATTTKAKIGAADAYYIAAGILGKLAAATDMPVLVGSVTTTKFNVFVFSVDKAGTTYASMGTEGATLLAVRMPVLPPERAVIGLLVINPTGAGAFVGGTTPLGDAGVVPNAVYLSPVGSFDLTATIR